VLVVSSSAASISRLVSAAALRISSAASSRSYKVGPGAHTFRVFAIDRAGNRDRSPALFAFRVRRR
jgi:hypothetical protein